nr:DNA helicase [Tanacetum cinerariifolium]
MSELCITKRLTTRDTSAAGIFVIPKVRTEETILSLMNGDLRHKLHVGKKAFKVELVSQTDRATSTVWFGYGDSMNYELRSFRQVVDDYALKPNDTLYLFPIVFNDETLRMEFNFFRNYPPIRFNNFRQQASPAATRGIVSGVEFPTYRAACEALGLLSDDKEWSNDFEEASKWASAQELRSLEAGGVITVEEIKINPPKASEVRIKMLCASICHTDILSCNALPFPLFPRIPGHKGVSVKEQRQTSYQRLYESSLWRHFKLCKLTQNMRLLQPNLGIAEKDEIASFSSWLLQIGDGIGINDENDPDTKWIANHENAVTELIHFIYSYDKLQNPSAKMFCDKAIVCPKNETAYDINKLILDKAIIYLSADSIIPRANERGDTEVLYPSKYLNLLNFSGSFSSFIPMPSPICNNHDEKDAISSFLAIPRLSSNKMNDIEDVMNTVLK